MASSSPTQDTRRHTAHGRAPQIKVDRLPAQGALFPRKWFNRPRARDAETRAIAVPRRGAPAIVRDWRSERAAARCVLLVTQRAESPAGTRQHTAWPRWAIRNCGTLTANPFWV